MIRDGIHQKKTRNLTISKLKLYTTYSPFLSVQNQINSFVSGGDAAKCDDHKSDFNDTLPPHDAERTHAASNTGKKIKQEPVRGGKKEKPTSRNAKSAWKRREKVDASKHNAEGPTKNLLRRCKEAPSKMYRHNLTGTHCNPQSRVEEGKQITFLTWSVFSVFACYTV